MLVKLINLFFSKIFKLPKNSVIIIYQGGLGNQLFQYFLGQELEKLYKKNVYYFDFRENYKISHNSNIENLFELNLRKYNYGKFNLFLRFIFLSPKVLKFKKFIFQKYKLKIFSNYYFDLIDDQVDLKKICIKENIIIFFGTWHNLINKYKYPFDLVDLKFKKNIYLKNSFNFKEKFISLHVRRGDYCNSKSARFHGNLDVNYYLKGTSFLRNKLGNLPVLIFSDDFEWIKNNLSYKIPNSFIFSSPKSSPEIDFYIMTKGNYFILSNSTFAWLSAFLSEKKDKFIVIPKFWFKNQKISSSYIYKDWKYKVI
tara:strand:+ start:288 stop:1223 length:936 start_codon:yes stop_codon:yes gene_type:complete